MKNFIKKIYGHIAKDKSKSCCGPKKSCCSGSNKTLSENIGYTKEELSSIPQDANLGLGCGNPVALASLKEGETVVDLGSGAGLDVFLAANLVGETGKVLGIDMTEEMIAKANQNAQKGDFVNVEFRLGDIENIPVDDNEADCIISNCAINLAEDKEKVFNEAFRILKPHGRLMVSDMVLLDDLPAEMLESAQLYAGCVAGALHREEYLDKIKNAGFDRIEVMKEDPVQLLDYIGADKVLSDTIKNLSEDDIQKINNTVVSLEVFAQKSCCKEEN